VRDAGYRELEAYSPHPIVELDGIVGMKHDGIAFFALIGGLSGGLLGFGMQAYAHVIDYPINVAGRPMFSWAAFVPLTFELAVLGSALSAVLAMLALSHLPQLWHPLFERPEFARASKDRFFLCVKATDPLLQGLEPGVEDFRLRALREFLAKQGAARVEEVPFEVD
jgi:hypothetical protein